MDCAEILLSLDTESVYHKLRTYSKIDRKEADEFLIPENTKSFLDFLVKNIDYKMIESNNDFFHDVFENYDILEAFNDEYFFMFDIEEYYLFQKFFCVFPNPKKVTNIINYRDQSAKIRKICRIWWFSLSNQKIALEYLKIGYSNYDGSQKFLIENLISFFIEKLRRNLRKNKIIAKKERFVFEEEENPMMKEFESEFEKMEV